jgi:hypothetical protein
MRFNCDNLRDIYSRLAKKRTSLYLRENNGSFQRKYWKHEHIRHDTSSFLFKTVSSHSNRSGIDATKQQCEKSSLCIIKLVVAA